MTRLDRPIDLVVLAMADPRRTELPAIIVRAAGHAVSTGALAIACATAVDPDERAALSSEMLVQADLYRAAIAAGGEAQRVPIGASRLVEERTVVHDFAARLETLRECDADPSRADAIELARIAREVVVPALQRILAIVQENEGEAIRVRLEEAREKAAMVDGLIAEMGRIGRMIGMISINASVEAARAGGESGRAFQAIAEEVRTLARRSSDVLDRIRSRLTERRSSRPHGAGPP